MSKEYVKKMNSWQRILDNDVYFTVWINWNVIRTLFTNEMYVFISMCTHTLAHTHTRSNRNSSNSEKWKTNNVFVSFEIKYEDKRIETEKSMWWLTREKKYKPLPIRKLMKHISATVCNDANTLLFPSISLSLLMYLHWAETMRFCECCRRC